MGQPDVIVLKATATPADWGRVLKTPAKELPKLDAERRDLAKRWGISEEDEQRTVLLQDLVEQRFQQEGALLASAVERILQGLEQTSGGPYELQRVVIDVADNQWLVRIERGNGRTVDIPLSPEFRATETDVEVEKLKGKLLTALGLTDMLRVG